MSKQKALNLINRELENKTGRLDLSLLKLKEIPSEIEELTDLTSLFLSGNRITKLEGLEKLTSLTRLHLEDNKISELEVLEDLVDRLGGLNNFTSLNLSDNQIKDVKRLGTLTKLTYLNLDRNEINDLNGLDNLKNLTYLNLDRNKVSDVSKLKRLINLTDLSLANNEIRNFAPLLPLLRIGLKLHLKNTKVRKSNDNLLEHSLNIFKYSKTSIQKHINKIISVGGNPITIPPISIIRQGQESVLNYLDQLEKQGQSFIFEAKLLILGEGGAGKTTFAGKVKCNQAALPKDDDTTKGIDVQRWEFDLKERDLKAASKSNLLENAGLRQKLLGTKFRVNLWDFGGQEIYHATHRFFLSGRSLYVLVADGRKQETDFNYWFNIVEQLSGESPLLVVINEKYGQLWRIDEAGLKSRFTFFKETRNLDLGEKKDFTKLEELRETMRQYVTRLPHIGDALPASWTDIREALAKETAPFISFDRYLEICKAHEMTDLRKVNLLSQYFHDIGVFLHYQKDPVLKNRIFLDSNWTTRNVYKLLNDKRVQDSYGRFSGEDIPRIWSGDQTLLIQSELLKLLERFKIAYRIGDTDQYIAPEHLPEQKPYTQWQYQENLLMLSYEFDAFMPKGLMTELIVELHRFIPDQQQVWRRGMVLKRDKAWAEVTEAYGNTPRFDIKVAGSNQKEFLIIIAETFDKMLERFPRLHYKKLVPCNCQLCKTSNDKSFFDYALLKKRLEKGKTKVECEKNNFEEVSIKSMLEATIEHKAKGISSIKELIAADKIEAAIDLLAYKDSNEAALIKRQFVGIVSEYEMGRIAFDERDRNLNRLTGRILRLSQKDDRGDLNPEQPIKNNVATSSTPLYKKWWTWLVGLIALLAGLAELTGYSLKDLLN